MNEEELVEITGTIKYKESQQGDNCIVHFTLLDDDGRLLAIRYRFKDFHTGQDIWESVSAGERICILVRGPIMKQNESYEGVGHITYVKEKSS